MLLLAAVTAALLVAPRTFLASGYLLDIGQLAFYYAILASTWSLLAGIGGQFSFAHVAIGGLSGYAGAVWSHQLFARSHLLASSGVSVAVGTAFGALVGIMLGLLLQRLRGAYLALFTIAFSEVALLVVVAESEVTNGRMSLAVAPQLPGFDTAHYYLMLAVLAAVLAVIYLLLRGRTGLNLRAMREDVEAAAAMGVNVAALKLFIIAFTALLVAFGAAMYFHMTPRLVPENLDLLLMSQVIAYAVIGGMDSPLASALSAIVLTFVLENLRSITLGPVAAPALAAALLLASAYACWHALRHSAATASGGVRSSLPWLVAGLGLEAWWLFAPAHEGGQGAVAGWLVIVAAVALLARAGGGRGVAGGGGRAWLAIAPAAAVVAVKLIAIGQVNAQVGVWRFALFGLILMLTLRFAPNGLFTPVLDFLAGRDEIRRLTVAQRDQPLPVTAPPASAAAPNPGAGDSG